MHLKLRFIFLHIFLISAFSFESAWSYETISLKISTRDGAHLAALLIHPDGVRKLPIILSHTPYGCDVLKPRWEYFVNHDFAFACVSTFGRGQSDGIFEPFVRDQKDAYDILEYLSHQKLSDGRIVMWGGSYLGGSQWAAAASLHPALKTIVAAAPSYPGVDFPYERNVIKPYVMQWLDFVSGHFPSSNYRDESYWRGIFKQLFVDGKPFWRLDELSENKITVFQDWIRHPLNDNYWQVRAATKSGISQMTIPVLTITGFYDGDQRGALTYFSQYETYHPKANYLVVGPWDHSGTRSPKRNLGGFDFGVMAEPDLNLLHLQWYNWILQRSTKLPDFLKSKVNFYSSGVWRGKNSLGFLSNVATTLNFSTKNVQNKKPDQNGIVKINYDPNQTDSWTRDMDPASDWIVNREYLNDLYTDNLILESEPFKKDLNLAGFLKLNLEISTNVPDSDLNVDVYDVAPNGASFYLTSDLLRLRYRNDSLIPHWMIKDQKEIVNFHQFSWFAKKILQGHFIRLVISNPNSFFIQKNYNSKNENWQQSMQDANQATFKFYLKSSYNQLVLPVE